MKQVTWYLAKKLLRMLFLLAYVSFAAFLLVSLSPVDPLQTNVGQTALGSMSPEQIENLREYWGVDQPFSERFFSWAGGLLRGEFGDSLLYHRSVLSVIGEKLGNSLWVLGFAWLFSGLFGYALGIWAGANRGKWPDKLVRGYSLLLSSTPVFWVGLLLLMIFGVWLQILPIGFSVPIGAETSAVSLLDRLQHAILPALTLSITGVSSVALHTREKMIDVMESDYMLFAMARGESKWRAIRRHGVRNTLLPFVTLQFASVGELIGGSILVEQVFSYPGLGQAAVTAGLGGDVPLLLGIVVITAAIVFLGNLIADLLYRVIDPRIRKGGTR